MGGRAPSVRQSPFPSTPPTPPILRTARMRAMSTRQHLAVLSTTPRARACTAGCDGHGNAQLLYSTSRASRCTKECASAPPHRTPATPFRAHPEPHYSPVLRR